MGATSRVALGIAASALLVLSSVVAPGAVAAGEEFPSWDEVSAARSNEAAQQALVSQIESRLAALELEAERTRADVDAKGATYREADQRFQEQAAETAELRRQADDAAALAAASEAQAGQLFAQLYRTGGADLTLRLLASADPAKLLEQLGVIQSVGEQASRVFDKAVQDRNSAQSQSDTAEVAERILQGYKDEAEAAFAVAQEAAVAAAAALTAAESARVEAAAKLAVLAESRAATEADYLAGVAARIEAGYGLAAGEISLSGWAKPVRGWISSSFGWRVHPISGGWTFHSGTDIAAGCGTPIYAGASGVVTYAGSNGGYGNYVEIDHGGVSTGYAHTQWGAILVSVGQPVAAGQQISSVGTTGNSTGCHLHLELRRGGVAEDAGAWFGSQGAPLG